jgi:hypothetical protein
MSCAEPKILNEAHLNLITLDEDVLGVLKERNFQKKLHLEIKIFSKAENTWHGDI